MDFPSTHWSALAVATLQGESAAEAALAEFYRRYREPVLQFIRRRGVEHTQAEDLAQDFFLHLMAKSTLRRADAARGRFRTFLLGALVRFLGDAQDRARAAKRGGGVPLLSLDAPDEGAIAPALATATAVEFDREWALQILTCALESLARDYAARGKTAEFAVLRAYVPGGVEPPPYEVAAGQLGIGVGALKTEVHRLRQRFRSCLREELAGTVASPEEIDGEIAYLGRVLQASSAANG